MLQHYLCLKRLQVAWAIVTFLLLGSNTIQAQTVLDFQTFEPHPNQNVNSMPAWNKAMSQLAKTPGATLNIAKGVYHFWPDGPGEVIDDPNHHYHLLVKGLDRVSIIGDDAEFIFHDPKVGGFGITGCKDLTLAGITMDWQPLPYTQGTIRSFAPKKNMVYFMPDPGFVGVDDELFQNARFSLAFAFDQYSDLMISGRLNYPAKFLESLSVTPGGLSQALLKKNIPGDGLAVGRRIVVLPRGYGDGIALTGCSGTTLRDLTMYSSPHLGIMFRAGNVGGLVQRVSIVPRPGTNRLISLNADGVHWMSNPKGITVEDSHIEKILDDGIAYTNFGSVVHARVQGKPNVLLIWAAQPKLFNPGDTVYAMSRNPIGHRRSPKVITQIRRLDQVLDAPYSKEKNSPPELLGHNELRRTWLMQINLDQPVDEETPGDSLFSSSQDNAQSMIRRNTIRNIRGIGIRGHGRGMIIEDNYIDGTNGSGVLLGMLVVPNSYHMMWCEDVIIRRNTIIRAGLFGNIMAGANTPFGRQPAIGITENPMGGPGRPNRHIEITDNTIIRSAQAGIHVWCAEDVTITGNHITNPNVLKWKSDHHGICLTNVHHARLEKNTVQAPKGELVSPIQIDENCQSVQVVSETLADHQ